ASATAPRPAITSPSSWPAIRPSAPARGSPSISPSIPAAPAAAAASTRKKPATRSRSRAGAPVHNSTLRVDGSDADEMGFSGLSVHKSGTPISKKFTPVVFEDKRPDREIPNTRTSALRAARVYSQPVRIDALGH